MQKHREHVMNGHMDLTGKLLTATPRPLIAALTERSTGIYAWWGVANVPWPSGFPTVKPERPLYVGKAQDESIGDRVKFHLGNTRGSAPRRSLTGLLLDVLPLRGHVVVRDPKRPSKFGLDATGERLLTEWMAEHIRLTWVALDDPGSTEEGIIRRLIPPLNDTHATGSPYVVPMRRLRSAASASAT
jgi:hypothetical protein